jgi:fatty acid desaturase
MLRWFIPTVRSFGKLLMKSTFWPAIGAMAIPLAVVLLLAIPDSFSSFWGWVALGLILFGVISVIIGWVQTVSEEKQRRREGIVSLYVLTSIAQKLGVDVEEAVKKIKELVDNG